MKLWCNGGGPSLSTCIIQTCFVFDLCDRNTVYCCKLDFYTGKKKISPCDVTFDIERLITLYLDRGRALYFDNFNTSPILFMYLKECGTLARPLGLGQSSLFCLTAQHFPCMLHPKPKTKRQTPQRKCVVCSERPKRKFSRFECQDCDVCLHVNRCSELFDTKKDSKWADTPTFEQSN
ncbi:hypothetical protein PoB_004576100 [Plakobranchus ocellatus]|uniref:PiggyBac transposable element-derived protein domain-containing protein n=1 Tax=Plakobranchus ocellatus TaxID=259542 RepID=A0AAV4B7B4_9GAST|nr:hypothetical protein PoB_004576100 [Plakobranchus ocellatus]